MDSLRTAQRVKITKNLLQNGNSNVVTLRTLSGDYDVHNRPTTPKIHTFLKKFEETGSVTPVQDRFSRSTSNIAAVSSRRSQEL